MTLATSMAAPPLGADEVAPPPRAANAAWSILIAPQGETVEFAGDGQVALVQPDDPFRQPDAGLPLIRGAQPLPQLPKRGDEGEEATAPAPQGREGEGTLPQIPAGAYDDEAEGPAIIPNFAAYAAVYRSIPFSRAEYDAVPSYRHDATMEFLFGRMRPTVVYKSPNPPPPSQGINQIVPFGYGVSTYMPGSAAGFAPNSTFGPFGPYSPFGYPYGGWTQGFWPPGSTVYVGQFLGFPNHFGHGRGHGHGFPKIDGARLQPKIKH